MQQRRRFEFFRGQLTAGIEGVTFDELFGRIERLIAELDIKDTAAPPEEPD